MPSKTERLMSLIRKTPLFRQLVPQEAGIGWPIPYLRANKTCVILPFFGFAPTTEKGRTAFPFSRTLSSTGPTGK